MRQKVDILTPAGFPATDAVRRATSAIPVVFVVPDPIGAKFAESLAHPGGNMTGMSLAIEEQFSGKWLELLKDAVPPVSRIAYLWNPNNTSSASSWSAMQGLAPKLGLALQSVELRDAKGLGQALETILRGRAEAVIVNSDAIMLSIDAQIVPIRTDKPAAANFTPETFCGHGWPDILRAEFARAVASRRHLCRQDPQGCQTR